MVDSTAPYAATQDVILAAQARESAGAAQAAAIKAAYMSNTLPVLPKYAAGGGATYTQAEIEDAAREAAKYASFNAPIDYAAYANVPLSQMPANVASRVQDYYAAHPSARAQEITSQYAAQHQIAENPYDPNSAAGIAWEVSRTGGVTTASLAGKAIGEGYQGPIMAVSGISTVPTRDLSSGMLSGSKMVAALPSETTTAYMPYGEFAQIEMPGSKLLLSKETGELGVYQQPYGHSQFMLTGGGGRAALQSGMFTIEKAETPYVVEQGKVGTYQLPSGKGLSRLGAEAYGGFVRPLSTENLLAPNEQISRYYGEGGKYNLANLVQPIAAGKAEVPGAKIPWGISAESPAIQYMDKGGIVPGSAISVPSGGRLVGGKTIAGEPTITETSAGALPAPFISATAPTAAPEKQDVFSQFGSWLAGAETYVGDVTGLSKLPTPTTEEIKKTAPYLAIAPGATPVGMALMTPGVSDYAAEYLKGELTAIKEKPATALVSFGVGLGMGAAFKGVEAGVGAARAAAAPKIIAEGGMYRAAEQFAGGIVKYGPKALGGLYAIDIGARVTKGGTDISPAAAGRAGTIMATEARPMTVGGIIGYAAPTKAYTAAREAQIGYKQAQVEIAGERTTLLQKPTAPGEVSFKDVATYLYGPKVSAAKLQAADILSGRTGEVTVGRAVELGAKPTERFAAAKQAALEAVITAKVLAKPTIEAGLGRASIEAARYRYATNQPIAEAVYGKYFEAKTKLPVKAEQALISTETGLWTFAQKAKTPGITIKSAIQERGGIQLPTLQRPTAEIARYNVMQEALKVPAKEPVTAVKPTAAKRTTQNIFKPEKPARTKFGVQTEKPKAKPAGAEIKTGKGISIAEVREVPREAARPTQAVELDIRGLPTYPSGPSPIQRQKYRVEEETQYLRLPPGMKSPGPKTLTVQEIVAIPSVMVGARQAQVQRADPLSLLSQDILQRQETTQKERQEQVKVRESLYGMTTLPRTELRPVVTKVPAEQTRTITVTEPVVTTKPKTTVTTMQKQATAPVEPITEISRGRTPQPLAPIIPGKFGLPTFGGGGGAGGGARKGSRAYVETLGFETSRGRKGAFTFAKRKVKK